MACSPFHEEYCFQRHLAVRLCACWWPGSSEGPTGESSTSRKRQFSEEVMRHSCLLLQLEKLNNGSRKWSFRYCDNMLNNQSARRYDAWRELCQFQNCYEPLICEVFALPSSKYEMWFSLVQKISLISCHNGSALLLCGKREPTPCLHFLNDFQAASTYLLCPEHWHLLQAVEAALKLEYNQSQMQALMSGLNGQQIVLIQVTWQLLAFCKEGLAKSEAGLRIPDMMYHLLASID